MSETIIPRAPAPDSRVLLRGKVWNQVASTVERQDKQRVTGPLEMTQGPDGASIRLGSALRDIRPVRISGISGAGTGTNTAYTFVQQNYDPDGVATDMPYAWTDTNTSRVAFEVNGTPFSNANSNTAALLLQTFDVNSGQSVYLFQAPLPLGQGIYKVLQLIDNNTPGTIGWDYVRAH